ncbi:class II glutamine amidotransferase [Planotetraspora mira]|uniref:class II glutamine amidotransferase n=1 Tax=Planotetraspora mira TaxID=58121 RepID=UPI001951F3DA|nr:hypothetical protein [Planotetraspora mira]
MEFSRIADAIWPKLFPAIEGSTDSEVMFFLALTFGLREDPLGAVERMVGFVEETGQAHGVEHPVQMTVATSDGERLWAFRYSTERRSRSLFHSTLAPCLGQSHKGPYLRYRPTFGCLVRRFISARFRGLPGALHLAESRRYAPRL